MLEFIPLLPNVPSPPRYSTEGAAGMDIRACENKTIPPGEWRVIYTGYAVNIPSGYELQVRPRSGLAADLGVTVLNTPGTIDSDYTGEIKVILINHGDEDFFCFWGDRIAQLVLAKVERAPVTVLQHERGEGGFGSTGVS